MSAFKVIIVGGGIAGLTLANCLQHARIDYVLLEGREEIGLHPGAAVSIEAGGARILDQLGVYDDIRDLIDSNREMIFRDTNGKIFGTMRDNPLLYKVRLGYGSMFSRRKELLMALLHRIWDQEKVHVNRRVRAITYENGKAVITCEDGSNYSGDVVVGCDGVHSRVRREMWRLSELDNLDKSRNESQDYLSSEYRGLYGISKPVKGLDPLTMTFVPSKNELCYWMVASDGMVGFVLFEKLDKKYCQPNVPKYTKEDAVSFAERHSKRVLISDTAQITFGDVWENVEFSTLLAVEEGFLENWTLGRIVCMGDSVHKVLPEAGLGSSLGMESAACLTNHLKALVGKCATETPTLPEIQQCLSDFQSNRSPRAKAVFEAVQRNPKMFTFQTPLLEYLIRYLLPNSGDASANRTSSYHVGAEYLECLPLPARSFSSTMPFNRTQGIAKSESGKKRALLGLPLLVLAALSPYWRTSSPVQEISTLPLYLIIMIEGSRRANEMKPISWMLLFSILISLYGPEVWVNVWFFLHYISSPIEIFAALDQRMLRMNYATALLPTVFVVLLLRMIPRSGYEAWKPTLPVLISVLHRLIASFMKDSTPYNRLYNTEADLPWIRAALVLASFASVSWELQFLPNAVAHWMNYTSVRVAKQTGAFITPAYVGAFFWLLLLHLDLKKARMLEVSRWQVLALGLVAAISVFNDVTGIHAAMFLMAFLSREWVLATKRHWGAATKAQDTTVISK